MRYYQYWHGEYREGTTYRKRDHHVKKVKSPEQLNKEAWREHCRVDQKHNASVRYTAGRKKCRKQGHRAHRNWTKRQIYNENWEKFHQDEIREFVNPWDWD